jgi:ribonuclease HII
MLELTGQQADSAVREVVTHRRHWTAGVDEAGRGPLAGPVAAAAVILDGLVIPAGLADSKTMTPEAREAAFLAILEHARSVSFVLLPPWLIDRVNIRAATLDAMRRAVHGLCVRPDTVIVDGRDIPDRLGCEARAIVGGDASHPCISAASIVAKVMRDRLMRRLGEAVPAYGFEIHKGYPTPGHQSAVRQFGPSVHHRLSFAPFKNGTTAI